VVTNAVTQRTSFTVYPGSGAVSWTAQTAHSRDRQSVLHVAAPDVRNAHGEVREWLNRAVSKTVFTNQGRQAKAVGHGHLPVGYAPSLYFSVGGERSYLPKLPAL